MSHLSFDMSTSSLGTIDLPKNYQNAVECLIQCEAIISDLQQQVAEKDERISDLEREADRNNRGGASKEEEESRREQLALRDRHIATLEGDVARLEEKIVQMSLDLASTRTREDRLENELKKSFTSTADMSSPLSNSICSREGVVIVADVSPPPSTGGGGSAARTRSRSCGRLGQFFFRGRSRSRRRPRPGE